MMHKKLYLILIIMVALAGILFFTQIRKATKITIKKSTTSLISPNATFIPLSTSELIFGNPGAPITIIEFVDFSCNECLTLHETIKSVVNAHPQDLRLIWKDAPQPKILSKNLTLAHQAGWCIAEQDEKKFWQFIDTASQNNKDLAESGLKRIAQNLNLNIEKWWECTNSEMAKQKITESLQLANSLGAKSLPAIFINNKLINTSADINIQEMLESFITK
ncbi:MAG: DsbA family protein [Candidatus Magasanikbacteria bacterium]|nr:DsbA family protein [Candidatus Magasanikbacteria bacterium]